MAEQIRNTNVTVDIASTEICPDRDPSLYDTVFRSIINNSTGGQTITISLEAEAQAGKGIPINAGGSYIEAKDAAFQPTNKRINAISDIAGGTLAVVERIYTRGK